MKTFFLLLTLALFAVPALAETYVWEDDQGTVNFTEDLGKVPKKYRKRARIVGEEESPPAAAPERKEPPAVGQPDGSRGGAAPVGKESVPAVKQDMKAVYGGKDAAAWKSEFAVVGADLKAAENQLVEYRNRLKDTGNMSRTQYLSLLNTIKSIESSVLGLRKKLDDLKKDAASAGVPAELME